MFHAPRRAALLAAAVIALLFPASAAATKADLSLTKSVSPVNAVPGDTVTYTLVASNSGPAAARDVVLSDTMPGGVTFVDATPGAPECAFGAGTLACKLGTITAGGSRTVSVRATVDGIGPATDHRHLVPVEKVEQQVDLEAGELRKLSLSCPGSGAIMADATVRVDAVDQGTGTLSSVVTRRARSTAPGTYEFELTNTATGRAQAKAFGTCLPATSLTEQGHAHRVLVGGPVTTKATLGVGRHEVRVPCGPGTVAVAPGIDIGAGAARLVGSEPEGNGRVFTVEVSAPATTVELSARCMSVRLEGASGHTHDLRLDEVERSIVVPAGQTVSESVVCADDAKGIVASYELGAGLYLAGHDPQPKSRVFRIVNPTGNPIAARIDLLCVGDRTAGPPGAKTIVNSAAVSSPTPDSDVQDRIASASLSVAPPPAGSGTVSLGDETARLAAGSGSVNVPLSCLEANCIGSVTLRAVAGTRGVRAGKVLGRSGFELDEGESARAGVGLEWFARRLAQRGRLKRLKASVIYADGEMTSGVLRISGR